MDKAKDLRVNHVPLKGLSIRKFTPLHTNIFKKKKLFYRFFFVLFFFVFFFWGGG